MNERQYNSRKVVELHIEAANRRHYDEIHPFVLIVANDSRKTILYLNRPILGLDVEKVMGSSIYEIYDPANIEKVEGVFAESLKQPKKAFDYYLELPTAQGMARFSEQCVYINDSFYVSGNFVGMY